MNKRKKRVSWTQQEELAFLRMMRKRKAEFRLYKKKTDIYKEISDDFNEMGIDITVAEIKNKIDSLTAKYRKVLAKIKIEPNACDKWPYFEAVHDIIETIYKTNGMEDPISPATCNFDINAVITENSRSISNIQTKSCIEVEAENFNIDLMNDHGEQNGIWTSELELTFVCMWAELKETFRSDKTNGQIYTEMSEQLKKLGFHLTLNDIKSKMQNLATQYDKQKKLMKNPYDPLNKWMLFDKMSDIIENKYRLTQYVQEDNTIEELKPSKSFECLNIYNDMPPSNNYDDNGNQQHNWNPEEELALVRRWCKYRAEVGQLKRNSYICRRISAEFQKLGKPLTPKDIKNKIVLLVSEYKKAKKSMELRRHMAMDWTLFNALREMIECHKYKYKSNNGVNDHLKEAVQADIEKLITCGQIQFSTEHLEFLYHCQFCEAQTDRLELFLQHILEEHLKKNDEQNQIYEEKAAKSDDTKELTNNLMDTSAHAANYIVDHYDNQYDEYEDKYYQEYDGEMLPEALMDLEENKLENQQLPEQEPLNFEVFYLNEVQADNKSLSDNQQPNGTEKLTDYVMKIQGPGELNLKYMYRNQQGYECPHCKQCFQQKYKLKVHIRNVHLGLKRYACSICKKPFKGYSNLVLHVKRHLNIKTHLCSVCGKTFASSTDLYTHMRMHTQEKPYKCTECTMTFRTSSRLAVHMRHHRNERPHGCEYCGKRFFIRKTWSDHLRTHTKEKPYECTICQRKFSQQSALRQHQKLHTNNKTYECQNCDAAFKQYAGLFVHLKRCTDKTLPGVDV